MNRYALIENSLVTNVTVADPEFAISQGWILCTDNVGIFSNSQEEFLSFHRGKIFKID